VARFVLKPDDCDRLAPHPVAVCTGDQTAELVSAIEAEVGRFVWYGVDMHAMSPTCGWLVTLYGSRDAVRIGDGEFTIREARQVSQFLSGVLCGVPVGQETGEVECTGTEDIPERLTPPVAIQIHLFDTSSIEVNVDDPALAAAVRAMFDRRGIKAADEPA
jgi:hypothetical protein